MVLNLSPSRRDSLSRRDFLGVRLLRRLFGLPFQVQIFIVPPALRELKESPRGSKYESRDKAPTLANLGIG
jgi:hypothetical protein